MSINVKRHALERYLERVDGVSDKSEIRRIATVNEKDLIEKIRKMYEHSAFVWRGQLFDNTTKNYYINGEYLLVTDVDNTTVITMWKADLGLPPAINKQTIKSLISEIAKLNDKVAIIEEKQRGKIQKKDQDNLNIDTEIAALEAKIALLKQRKAFNEAEVKVILGEVTPLRREIDQYATMICNSQDYKNDLLELKKVV